MKTKPQKTDVPKIGITCHITPTLAKRIDEARGLATRTRWLGWLVEQYFVKGK